MLLANLLNSSSQYCLILQCISVIVSNKLASSMLQVFSSLLKNRIFLDSSGKFHDWLVVTNLFHGRVKTVRNKFRKNSLNEISTIFWRVLNTFRNCKFWYYICVIPGECNRKCSMLSNKSKKKFRTVYGNDRKLKKECFIYHNHRKILKYQVPRYIFMRFNEFIFFHQLP